MLVFSANTGFSLIRKLTTGSTALTFDMFGYAAALGQERIAVGRRHVRGVSAARMERSAIRASQHGRAQ
jgi:hypothetical protein